MKNRINYYYSLLPCESVILTGSQALMRMGLLKTAKDLDLIIVKPNSSAIETLKKLDKREFKEGYPKRDDHFQIINEDGGKVDFFITDTKPETIMVNGVECAMIYDIARAKQNYKSFKHIIQLRFIADIICPDYLLKDFIKSETHKLKRSNDDQK